MEQHFKILLGVKFIPVQPPKGSTTLYTYEMSVGVIEENPVMRKMILRFSFITTDISFSISTNFTNFV